MKKHLIVAGYPKSGNTWLTRLLAELVHCPVEGFWSQPENNEIAIEGKERESEYRCFKAHHLYSQLLDSYKTFGNGSEKVIYIVRDPRDVVVSATFFFNRLRGKRTLQRIGLGWLYNQLTLKMKLTRFCEIVANGGDMAWMYVSWADHVKSYVKSDALIVRYEDLLDQPLVECRRMTDFIGIQRSDNDILQAIDRQSFKRKKKEFRQKKRFYKADFMRSGVEGQWRDVFSKKQQAIIINACGASMEKLGYR